MTALKTLDVCVMALKMACMACLVASMASGCAVSAVDPALDDDGDGLDNATEAAGWTVTIQTAHGVETRTVTSRIDLADTDGDGLDDREEWGLRLDPTRADTDGDGLDDRREVVVFGSAADNVDSDGDADGKAQFFDGGEVELGRSSPALADTDGDGFDDRTEMEVMNTDPRIADLPSLELAPGAVPEIGLNTVLSNGVTDTVSVSESVTRSVSMSHGESRTTSESFSLMVGFGLEAGWSGGIHVVASFETQMTTTRELSLTLSRDYTEAAAAEVGETRQRALSEEITCQGGYVAFPVHIRNTGPVSFTLRNASMTLSHRNRQNPWLARALAHVEPADGRTVFPPRTLEPGQAHDGVYFRSDRLGCEDAAALMLDPRGLELAVSGYELVDEAGRAFAHDGTLRQRRTATVVIDHGPTFDGAFDGRHVLATNMKLDPATGEPAGVLVVEALRSWLEREVEVVRVPAAGGGEATVLLGLDGHRATGSVHAPSESRWNVVLLRDGVGEVVDDGFDRLRLMPGDVLYLVFDEDKDRDGLGVRTEARLGTSDVERDSDGDGLSDGEEVLHGQTESDPRPTYAVADPTRADTDGDGLGDAEEIALETDAFDVDTDNDGLGDAIDRAPLVVDVFALADFEARPVQDGAAIELSWEPVDNAAIEAVYVVRAPIDELGRFVTLPADIWTLTPDEVALELGGDVVATLDPSDTRFVDTPSGDGGTWRYLALVGYADVGLLPAAEVRIDHGRVLRYDRLRVTLEALDYRGEDECDVYWEASVAPGTGEGELNRRTFRLSPQDAIEIGEDRAYVSFAEGYLPGEYETTMIVPRDGTGATVVFAMWAVERRGNVRLGAHTVPHARGEFDGGTTHTLRFSPMDDEDDDECVIEATYRIEVAERGVVDPGAAALQ